MSGIWGPPVAHRTPPHEGQVSRTGFLKPSHLAKAPRSQKGPGWETLSPRTEVHSREGLRLPTTRFAPKSPQRQDHLCLLPGDCGQPSTCSRLSLLAHPRLCTPQADFRATGKQHCLALRLPTLRPSSASEAEEQRLPPRRRVRSLSKHAVPPSPVITSILPPRRPRHRGPQLPARHQSSPHSG